MSTAPRRDAAGVSRRRMLVGLAWLVLLGGALVLLYPVLASPVNADDRYWYLEAPGRAGGSLLGAVAWTLEEMEQDAVGYGRITTLAFLARRLSAIVVTDLAVATATPIVAVQAGLKVLLLVAAALSCLAYLRVLRFRGTDGTLRRLSTRTVTVVTVVLVPLVAVGAQAQMQFRNGWTSYALLTYGTVIVLIGSVALLVWLTRWVARSASRVVLVVGVLVAVVLGIVLNISYELYYVAVPLVVVAVAQQPMLDGAGAAGARRAKLLVGGSFALSFVVCFVAIRAWLARLCSQSSCYEGAQPDLGSQTVVTALRNFLTAVPGAGRSELAADLRAVGMEDQLPGLVTPTSLLVAGAVAVAMVVLVLTAGTRGSAAHASTASSSSGEVRLLLLAATVPLAAAVGTALIMALSGQAHEIVLAVGHTYRNTMATWTTLALSAALLVGVADVLRPRSWTWLVPLGLVVTLLGAYTFAGNVPALRAYRAMPQIQATDAIQWQVVLGDRSEEGDERRCETLTEAERLIPPRTMSRLHDGAELSFELYHGLPYCSQAPEDR